MNIYDAALRKLEHRSRTVWEMKKHLADKEFQAEEIDQVIEEFLELGYLNDYKYCQEYFPYGYSKGKGKMKIFSELKQKGVDPEVISKAFNQLDEPVDEKEIAMAEALKILRGEGLSKGDEIPEKILGRIGRRLSSKGFPASLVYGIIGELRQ